MGVAYSVETCKRLAEAFGRQELLRPRRVDRYEPGTELIYDMTGVVPAGAARVTVVVDRFVGGGFAGQVYLVTVKAIKAVSHSAAAKGDGGIAGLSVGGKYAVKILVPPGRFAQVFRNAIYFAAFQSSFQLQVNPAAARAGALWQKFIRRAAGIRFGQERAVRDIMATFVDPVIGGCGEISEWIEGRTWRFEVDDHLFARWFARRKRAKVGTGSESASCSPIRCLSPVSPGSPEYLAKKDFMAEMVRLLHDLGAPELARQYEWWTCKSQPNCLKRSDTESDPAAGLTAADFRAGLALLPFLPMSPGDIALILKGLLHGRLVQFDRGDLGKLQRFIDAHPGKFADMKPALEELQADEQCYRDSQIDITHNHVRLLYSGRLWSTIGSSAVTGWRVQGRIDEVTEKSFRRSRLAAMVFAAVGFLAPLAALAGAGLLAAGGIAVKWAAAAAGASPWWRLRPATLAAGLGLLVIVPLACRLARRMWGRSDLRAHYGSMLLSPAYLGRAIRGRVIEKVIGWLRCGRVSAAKAEAIADSLPRFLLHLPLSVLPAGVHRAATDASYAVEKLSAIFVRPIRLYFNADAREQWLRDMVAQGRRNHLVTDEDAEAILGRVKEPFIQKYLKCLAVHVCMAPVTHVVAAIVAVWYWLSHPELSTGQLWARALGIMAFFQLIPLSPGSLCRGLYVLYLVVRERDFKNYNIAVFLAFFKYFGYLAFPIQMAYRYPALARFMAGHWATSAVHVVPVFGEKGALLEHFVFDMFYNYPLTIRRGMAVRAAQRVGRVVRDWHALACIAGGTALLTAADVAYRHSHHALPTELKQVWYAVALAPLLAGWAAAAWGGGAAMGRRIALAALTGLGIALTYLAAHATLAKHAGAMMEPDAALEMLSWSAFAFVLLATLGGLVEETHGRVREDRLAER
jgi:hypothetical protein